MCQCEEYGRTQQDLAHEEPVFDKYNEFGQNTRFFAILFRLTCVYLYLPHVEWNNIMF